MREIEFRGRDTDGIWHYGSLIKSSPITDYKGYRWEYGIHTPSIYDNTHHLNWTLDVTYVRTDTVGQFTGLYDKHGKKIYEGDICRLAIHRLGEEIVTIIWNNGFWIDNPAEGLLSLRDFVESDNMEIDVIGNIHDNPELL